MLNKFSQKNEKKLKIIDFVCSKLYKPVPRIDVITQEQVKKIIIIAHTLLGDAVMMLPFIQILHDNFSQAELYMVCDKSSKIIFSKQGIIKTFYDYDQNKIFSSPISLIAGIPTIVKILHEINKNEYDIAVEPRGDLRFILLMHYMKAKIKISYPSSGGNYLLNKTIPLQEGLTHIIQYELNFLIQMGCDFQTMDTFPCILSSDSDLSFQENFKTRNQLHGKKLTGIHPGASLEIKQWDHYPDILRKLSEHDSKQIFLIFEGPGEEKIVNELIAAAEQIKAKYIRIKESLNNYINIVNICDRIICNDSGAAHIAAACNIPVVVLYGPTGTEIGKPYGRGKISLHSGQADCKPCFERKCKYKKKKCFDMLSVDEIVECMENVY